MKQSPSLRIPHTLALLFFLMIAALVATWLVPQGFFAEDPESGRVVPGSYEVVAEREVLSPLALFTAIPRAFVDAGPIIFFLFIIGGVLAMIRATGTIDALLGRLLERFRERPRSLIFAVIFVFSLASSAVGSSVPVQSKVSRKRLRGRGERYPWLMRVGSTLGCRSRRTCRSAAPFGAQHHLWKLPV